MGYWHDSYGDCKQYTYGDKYIYMEMVIFYIYIYYITKFTGPGNFLQLGALEAIAHLVGWFAYKKNGDPPLDSVELPEGK